MAKTFPWPEELAKMEALFDDEIFYSPSLEFRNIEDNHSLTLTAVLENGQPTFSLWYNRPVVKKILFGKKQKMNVIDKGMFNLTTSLLQLGVFLNKDYQELEKFMTS